MYDQILRNRRTGVKKTVSQLTDEELTSAIGHLDPSGLSAGQEANIRDRLQIELVIRALGLWLPDGSN